MESDKAEKPPAETPPDHLSIDPKNSYYNEAILNLWLREFDPGSE